MSLPLTALRVVLLPALAVSVAGVIDWWAPGPVFCGFEAGCEAVTGSAYGRPLGVPLPVVGLAGFGLLFVLTLLPGTGARRLLHVFALLGALAGLGLLLLQILVLRRLCSICLVADACAMLAGMLVLMDDKTGTPSRPPRRWIWGTLAILALVAPLAITWWDPPPPLPDAVRDRWVSGKITLVVVTDFECEHCRATHEVLADFLAEEGEKVHLVTLVFPLPQNPHSRQAARAYWCASRQGKAGEMAEALFAADDLSERGCEAIAKKIGLDTQHYRACLEGPELDAAIDASTAWVDRKRFRGLPLLWVQDQVLISPSPQALRDAYQRAQRRAQGTPDR